uniref:Uncharacterized protein n=1 Tax=Oryza glumipatula TaxID=40148 RepID=A0A0D9Z5C1_9ORYZ
MRMREAADHAHKCRGHGAVSRLFPTVVHAARERVPSIHMRRGEERPDFPPHRRISQGPSRRRSPRRRLAYSWPAAAAARKTGEYSR